MARRALLGLILGGLLGGVIPVALGQAIAESAVIHAGSGISAGVARSLGGHIQQSLSNSQSQFSYPPRRLAQTRNRRGRARTRSTSGSPIAIRSVQGGQAPCTAAAKKDDAAKSSSKTSCVATSTAPAAVKAPGNPSEITVSF